MGYFSTPRGQAGGGGGSPGIGPRIFGWNKTDLTQFDTANLLSFINSLGTAAAGTMTPSFVLNGYRDEPVIRLSAAALTNGIVLPVLASELTLPEHYFVRTQVVGIDASLAAAICPFGDPDGTQWRGAVYRRDAGSAQSQPRLTTDDGTPVAQVLRAVGVASTNPSADTWNAALEARGGMEILLECWRQNNDDPTDWNYRVLTQEAGNLDIGACSRDDCTGFADPGAPTGDWDGTDMTRLALGVFTDGGGAITGDVDFLDLQVFEAD